MKFALQNGELNHPDREICGGNDFFRGMLGTRSVSLFLGFTIDRKR